MELIKGTSPSIQRIKDLIRQVVDTDLNVLICGESGVGKEVIARTLHAMSSRRSRPLVKVNCAALPGELLESELFGHERGAFTGAIQAKPGKFELANQGTIFLDEIGDMPINLQAKLLQVLQDGVFCRVGGLQDISVNTWVIAATNHDLEKDVRKGTFREDLLYRLNLITITVPPLRERKEDIPSLMDFFLKKHVGTLKKNLVATTTGLDKALMEYNWPGNVRELENFARRLLVIGDPDELEADIRARLRPSSRPYEITADVPTSQRASLHSFMDQILRNGGDFPPLKEIQRKVLARFEKIAIEEALERTGWNRREAAKLLQISYKALSYKIRDFRIKVPGLFTENGISLTPPEDD